MVVVSDDRAYFVGSTGYTATSNSLYRFNPGSDAAPVVVNGFADKDLGALAVDPYGQLWIGRSSDAAPGLSVLGFDGSTETVNKALIDTVLTPLNIDFVSAAKACDDVRSASPPIAPASRPHHPPPPRKSAGWG